MGYFIVSGVSTSSITLDGRDLPTEYRGTFKEYMDCTYRTRTYLVNSNTNYNRFFYSILPRWALVIGTTRDESALFTAFDPSRTGWNDADINREFSIRFGERTSTAVDTYRQHRPEASANQMVTAMQTDQIFRWPAWSLAPERSSNTSGSSTWMYAFDFATPSFGGVLGSCHALDIPFAFDNLHRPGVDRGQAVSHRHAQVIVTVHAQHGLVDVGHMFIQIAKQRGEL